MSNNTEKKLTFFITGSGGFIGKSICKYLEKEGQNIVKYNRLDWDFHPLLNCDVVIHLSAYGNHYNQRDIEETIKRNVVDLSEMLFLAKQSTVLKKFYNISSSSVTLPVQTMYSASKLFGETMINSLNDERFINVRPYSVYGPGEADHRFIPTIIRCLKSGETMPLDTESRHDWILVSDFIEAMFSGATEVGTGLSYSNLEIVNMLEIISKRKLNFEPKQLRSFDNKDWVCPKSVKHIPIYEGLKLTYDSYTV